MSKTINYVHYIKSCFFCFLIIFILLFIKSWYPLHVQIKSTIFYRNTNLLNYITKYNFVFIIELFTAILFILKWPSFHIIIKFPRFPFFRLFLKCYFAIIISCVYDFDILKYHVKRLKVSFGF